MFYLLLLNLSLEKVKQLDADSNNMPQVLNLCKNYFLNIFLC